MCWSATASIAMVGVGASATIVAMRRKEPTAIWLAIGYFTVMELLQAAGYGVIGDCGAPANQTLALLLYLHIAFQPLFVNAFAMATAPVQIAKSKRLGVYLIASLATLSLILRLVPFEWAGSCAPEVALCGSNFCVERGDWHLAWELPLNDFWGAIGAGFVNFFPYTDYFVAVFFLPLFYGAWRFVIFHALLGPILASTLTTNPNEMPAIWCLFSIGIILVGLSPLVRKRVLASSR